MPLFCSVLLLLQNYVTFFVLKIVLFIFCSPKKRTKKGRPQIFFGITIFPAAHALQLAHPLCGIAQTVMLT